MFKHVYFYEAALTLMKTDIIIKMYIKRSDSIRFSDKVDIKKILKRLKVTDLIVGKILLQYVLLQ